MSSDRSHIYNSFRGRSKSKFLCGKKPKNSMADEKFFAWTQHNMYRTSYHDMSKRVSIGE
jgi:hypothetical protein